MKYSSFFLLLSLYSIFSHANSSHTNLSHANSSDTLIIKEHLTNITKTEKARNYKNLATLNQVAAYIYETFDQYADTTYYQTYEVEGNIYKNVICVFGSSNPESIVVGAHYDVCGDQEGADGNASGTVGLLELARLLKDQPLTHRLELVAYTLEEPPFFRTKQMGSYVHAQSLKAAKTNVLGMVCLEMIGYFDDRKDSQAYPMGLFSWFYGTKGDYITLVNKFGKGRFCSRFNRQFKKKAAIKTETFTGPKQLEGIDFSDHLNYWALGFDALMITDTAFYRNHNYHKKTDQMHTLNLTKMAQVIDGVYQVLIAF